MSVLVPPPPPGKLSGSEARTSPVGPSRTILLDAGALAWLSVLTVLVQPYLFASETLVSVDTATQYYSWYAFLGESLRAGHIPGWNPASFSGAPFAADPLSGW